MSPDPTRLPSAERRATRGPAGRLSYLVWAPDADLLPVALAHPVNTQAAVWDQLAPLLTEGGTRPVVAVDYRGHGMSYPDGPFTPEGYAADLLAVLDAESIDRFHYAGGSIGGAVGIHVARMAGRRVLSESLLAAAAHIGVTDEAFDEMAAGLRVLGVDEWFRVHGGGIVGSASVPGVPARLVELSGGRDTEQVIEIIDETFRKADARDAAASLAFPPAQVIGGAEDPTCPPDMERELAALVGGSVTILDGIGHLPMLEAPERTAQLVLALISAVENPVPPPSA